MASDSDAARRKHRRSSSDDEAEKSSKRHKHRHHHHRHRRCRSKKHGEDTKQGGEDIVPATLPPPVPVANSNEADNDDVEEGEILEEEGSGGVDVEANELHEQVPDSQNLVCSVCPLLSLFFMQTVTLLPCFASCLVAEKYNKMWNLKFQFFFYTAFYSYKNLIIACLLGLSSVFENLSF
jgi:hypothetical protein